MIRQAGCNSCDLPIIFGKIFCKKRYGISEKIYLYHLRGLSSHIIPSLKHLLNQDKTKTLNKLGLSCAKLRLSLASHLNKLGETSYKHVIVFQMSLTLKLDYNRVHISCQINFHGWVGWVGCWIK
jgi:hypothetical protein